MRAAMTASSLLALATLSCGQHGDGEEPVELTTENDKILYSLGQGLVQQSSLKGLLTAAELRVVERGFGDAVLRKDSAVSFAEYAQRMNEFVELRRAEKNDAWGREFRETAAAVQGAVTTESGLIYREATPGTGARPTAQDTVVIDYTVRLVDGELIDTSEKVEGPARIALNSTMPGWAEGMQMMRVGGASEIVLPPELAFGEVGQAPAIPPNATLVFKVELLDIARP